MPDDLADPGGDKQEVVGMEETRVHPVIEIGPAGNYAVCVQ